MIIKPALAIVCGCLLIGCKSLPVAERSYPAQTSPLDPAGLAFVRGLHYPYMASKTRRQRIEHALKKIHLDSTEQEVLAALGPPDIKTHFAGYPPEISATEDWEYIHTLKRPPGPYYAGKSITVILRETRPRTVYSIYSAGFKTHPSE